MIRGCAVHPASVGPPIWIRCRQYPAQHEACAAIRATRGICGCIRGSERNGAVGISIDRVVIT